MGHCRKNPGENGASAALALDFRPVNWGRVVVAGVCIDCGHPVGSGNRPCGHCGCAEPMPTRARLRCVSCGNGVMTAKQPCSHCGAPDPLDAGPILPALARCPQCGNPTHVAAAQCRKCRAPSGCIEPGAATVSWRESAAIAAARPDATASQRLPSARFGSSAPLAAPLWDPHRSPLPTHRPPSEPQPLPGSVAAAHDADDNLLAPPTADLRNRLPCGRCGELQPRGTRPCPRCGVADPETAEPIAPTKPLFGRIRIPVVPAVVTVVGLLALAGLTGYTRITQEQQRHQRIWQALGSLADEERVAAVVAEASAIGVSTDVLLRVRFICLRHEPERPTTAALRQVRLNAERDGRDPEAAVSEAARLACQR